MAIKKVTTDRARQYVAALPFDEKMKLAEDERTSADVLGILSEDEIFNVRRAVAMNRSTPVSALEVLAGDLVTDVVVAVAGNRSAPRELLAELSESVRMEVLRAVALNPSADADTLYRFARSVDAGLRTCAANNPACPDKAVLDFAQNGLYHELFDAVRGCGMSDELSEKLMDVEAEPVRVLVDLFSICKGVIDMPYEFYESLCLSDFDDSDRCIFVMKETGHPVGDKRSVRDYLADVACSTNVSPEWLKVIARFDEPKVRANVASNANVSVEVLEELSRSCSSQVCMAVLAREDISSSVVGRYVESMEVPYEVFLKAVGHPQCPPELLCKYAGSSNKEVRNAVLSNVSVPQDVMSGMIGDAIEKLDYDALKVAVRNPSLPLADGNRIIDWYIDKFNSHFGSNWKLEQQCGDVMSVFMECAVNEGYLNRLFNIAKSIPAFFESLFRNGSFTSVMLDRVAREVESQSILQLVARHDNVSSGTLRRLAKESSPVREAVASNVRTPVDVLNVLTRDESAGVRDRAFETRKKVINAVLDSRKAAPKAGVAVTI